MAVKTEIICDITGEPGARELLFAWGNKAYEIDLTSVTLTEIEEELIARLISNARQIGQWGPTRRANTVSQRQMDAGKHTPEEREALRAWMEKNGVSEGKRQKQGRVGSDIWAAFRANDLSLLKPGRLEGSEEEPEAEESDAA